MTAPTTQRAKLEDIRVIDQLIGDGIGEMNTVIRLYHIPTGILIEVPPTGRGQHRDRQIGMDMLEYALCEMAQ